MFDADTNAHADTDRQRMQPLSARLPGWENVQLLLRHLGVHAAVSALLCASVFRADAGTDAVAKHDTHLSSPPAVPVPAGLREGVRVRWRMHDMPLCPTDNAYCDTDINADSNRAL